MTFSVDPAGGRVWRSGEGRFGAKSSGVAVSLKMQGKMDGEAGVLQKIYPVFASLVEASTAKSPAAWLPVGWHWSGKSTMTCGVWATVSQPASWDSPAVLGSQRPVDIRSNY